MHASVLPLPWVHACLWFYLNVVGDCYQCQCMGVIRCSAGAGMFYHVFDNSDKIKDIYFLRQLQHDEAERKARGISISDTRAFHCFDCFTVVCAGYMQ